MFERLRPFVFGEAWNFFDTKEFVNFDIWLCGSDILMIMNMSGLRSGKTKS